MASTKLLKMDAAGRVRTPKAKREEILDEFDGSGVSGAEIELPGGVRLRITGPDQVPLAVQLVRSLASC